MKTVEWRDDRIAVIDQTRLPTSLEVVELRTVDDVVDAIARLVVRGAPTIGAVGALGVALAAVRAERAGLGTGGVEADAARIRAARPTAANLAWRRSIGERGADLVQSLAGPSVAVHTHCNTGALACVEWGSALGVVRSLHERGGVRQVFVDETRPLLQGARLTAFELAEAGIPYRVVVDAAGPSLIARGLVDAVVVGADRIAANGDVANKIGTYPLALAADRAGVPFIVAAPESTIDVATADGEAITIEQRDPAEVLHWQGTATAPEGAGADNPAFDVTPHDLVTAVVTDRRVIRLADGHGPL